MFGCSEKFSYLCNRVKEDPSPLAQKKFNNQNLIAMDKQFKVATNYSAQLAAQYCLAYGIEFFYKDGKTYFVGDDSTVSKIILTSYGRAKEEEFLAGAFTAEYVKNQI